MPTTRPRPLHAEPVRREPDVGRDGPDLRLRISAIALKSVEHVGGLDNFLMKADNDKLSDKALRLKRSIAKKLEAAKAAA